MSSNEPLLLINPSLGCIHWIAPPTSQVAQVNGVNVNVAVCGNAGGGCTGAGACGSQVSYGQTNDRLHYAGEQLFLEYTDGDACPGAGGNYRTTVRFVCDEDANPGTPVYDTLFSDDCHL